MSSDNTVCERGVLSLRVSREQASHSTDLDWLEYRPPLYLRSHRAILPLALNTHLAISRHPSA